MQKESANRKFDFTFPRQIAVVFVVLGALVAYPLCAFAPADVTRACIAGVVISVVNVLAGYAAIEYSIDKSYSVFLRTVLGGMGIRMLAMLGAILVLIKALGFNAAALVVSLFACYTVFLILEVLFIQKKMTKKAEG